MQNGIRINPEQIDAMKRGGRPTLEELSKHLMFNPLDASILLSGQRMVLQRAAIATDLRNALEGRHGHHEAKVMLTRIGYRLGIADAQFIRSAWPNISVGDAFTAGTRLHMLSGIVNVETIGNDFDFGRDRYASEFLWHNSVEASEYHRVHGRAMEPVCWMQTGYAAGYASHFFQKLVIYREVECAAMGHKSCRLKGGTIDRWAADDPLVAFYREEIIPGGPSYSDRAHGDATSRTPPKTGSGAHRLDDLVLSPVSARIEQVAKLGLPALFVGPAGSGRARAAQRLKSLVSPKATLMRVHCGRPDIAEALKKLLGSSSRAPQRRLAWLLEDIELLPAALQLELVGTLTQNRQDAPLCMALTTKDPARGEMATMRPDLLFAFIQITLPPIATRNDLEALASGLLEVTAQSLGKVPPTLSSKALTDLQQHSWPGNLPELGAALREALLTFKGAKIAQLDCTAEQTDASTPEALSATIGQTPLDLDRIMLDICQTALERAGGNMSAAARSVGLSRAQLAYRLQNADKQNADK